MSDNPTNDPIHCLRCGHVAGYGNEVPTPSSCSECSNVVCGECGDPDDRVCSCWVTFDEMSLADIKAAFAGIDLSITKTDAGGVS